jgi:hypothetical protein
VRFGKIGTDGQQKTKSFDYEARAKKDYDKLIGERRGRATKRSTPTTTEEPPPREAPRQPPRDAAARRPRAAPPRPPARRRPGRRARWRRAAWSVGDRRAAASAQDEAAY